MKKPDWKLKRAKKTNNPPFYSPLKLSLLIFILKYSTMLVEINFNRRRKMRNLLIITVIFMLISVSFFTGCTTCDNKQSSCSKAGGALHEVTSEQMKEIVDSKSALIFDARFKQYDDGSRIPGAKALSYSASPAEVAKAIPDKSQKVVVYCSNVKCPASRKLGKLLKSYGYTNVIEYPEGIQGWADTGYPIEKAK